MLTSLTGLEGISNVNGYVEISMNSSLNSLSGLSNMTSAGALILMALPLFDLNGLEQLSMVNGDLKMSSFPSLNSISSLGNLTQIDGILKIESCKYLKNLSGLENLTEIGGGLEIKSNSSLTNIDALNSVTSIGGDLIISYNTDLTSLAGLSSVTEIDGDLHIYGLSGITSLSSLQNIDPASIVNMEISWSRNLTDCAFPNICEYLEDPNGEVDIYNNGYPCDNPIQIANECGINLPCLPYGNYHFLYQSQIDSFQIDYPGCTDLEGSLFIHQAGGGGTGDFTNLDGLSVVTSINGILQIGGAHYLTSLSGIDNIDGASISDLYIVYSPLLSECEVRSICDYLANPNGEVEIEGNASGCNSPEEVYEACETVSIQEKIYEPIFNIYPNPTNRYLFIDKPGDCKIIKIRIYNTIGQVLFSQDYKNSGINVSELDDGVYVLEINSEGFVLRMKFLVKN